MTPDELYDEFRASFRGRKFIAGLLVAFIDFLTSLGVPTFELSSLENFHARFKRLKIVAGGRPANTLIVDRGDGQTLSIRPFYNAAERYFRAEQKRFDYPSCAPHATQAWVDYTHWLGALVTFSDADLKALRDRVCRFVLTELESHEFDPASVRTEPPLFRLLLEGFELTKHKGEPTGAAFQGVVFGFLRADNPHLQIEIDKVRTGSKRLQRVGDVDGWEGGRLAISAEVKQYAISLDDVPGLGAFANETVRRGTLGLVAALEFKAGVREQLNSLGILSLDKGDMLRIVVLWDPLKQRTAVASVVYYARHVEKNTVLAGRIEAFLTQAAQEWEAARPGPPRQG